MRRMLPAQLGQMGAVKVKSPGEKSSPCSAMRPSLGGDGSGGLDACFSD